MESERKIEEIAENLNKVMDEMAQLTDRLEKLNANVERLLSPFLQENNDKNELAKNILNYVEARYGDENN